MSSPETTNSNPENGEASTDDTPTEPGSGDAKETETQGLFGRFVSKMAALKPNAFRAVEERNLNIPSALSRHQDYASAEHIEWHPDYAIINHTKYVRTYVVDAWPRQGSHYILYPLLSGADIEYDLRIHIDPYDELTAVSQLARWQERLKDKANGAFSMFTLNPEATEESARACGQLKNEVENSNINAVDVAITLTVRADTLKELNRMEGSLREKFEARGGMGLSKVTYEERAGLRSTSPLAITELEDRLDSRKQIMGTDAAASTFPFISDSIMEPNGVLFGENYAYNTPVVLDVWNRSKGYNILRVGDIGSGKSFAASLTDILTALSVPDMQLAIIDPMGDYAGVCQALGGDWIVINGTENINPLEIKPVSQSALDRAGGKLAPFRRKLEDVYWFLDRFYTRQDTKPTAQEWAVLKTAVVHAYRWKGITTDIDTHDRESPTMTTVREVLQDMIRDPAKYSDTDVDAEIDERRDIAKQILISLDPFRVANGDQEDGELAHLAQPTDIDLGDSRVTYLDMQSISARDSDLGLMMQLMFSHLYQDAIQTEGPYRLTIDEAHKVLKDSTAPTFFEEVFRHSRHYDLSVQLITQTFEEFFPEDNQRASQAAETIAKQCSVRIFHPIENPDSEIARKKLDLSENHLEVIKDAQRGEGDKDFSEALMVVSDHGAIPLKITTTQDLKAIITYKPEKGWDDEDLTEPRSQRIRQLLDHRWRYDNPIVNVDEDELAAEVRRELIERDRRRAQLFATDAPELLPANRISGFEEKLADHFGGKIATGSAFLDGLEGGTTESNSRTTGIGDSASTEYDPSKYVTTDVELPEDASADESTAEQESSSRARPEPPSSSSVFGGMDEGAVRKYVKELSPGERSQLLESIDGVSADGGPSDLREKLVYIGVNGVPDGGEAELRSLLDLEPADSIEAESDDD